MHPILFELHGLRIGTYGLFAALGLALGLLLFSWLASRDGWERWEVAYAGTCAFLVGLFASKLVGVAVEWRSGMTWSDVLTRLLHSSGIYYVGFFAAVAYFVVAFRKLGIRPALGLDYLAPGLALAHGIGRMGCYFAGCCWGKTCDLAWSVTFAKDPVGTGVPLDVPLHPTQIYESLAELAIALLLTWKAIRAPWRAGSTFLLYVVLYGITRFLIEFLRDDPRGTLFGWPTSQPIALGSAALALILLALLARRRSDA